MQEITGTAFTCMNNEYILLQLQVDPTSNLFSLSLSRHTSNKMSSCLYLFLLFLSFYSCSTTKLVCHKISNSLKTQCPFFGNTTIIPSHQMTTAATITHFDVLFNSNSSAHTRILVCSTFAPFCFNDFSVPPCRQLCLLVKSSCIYLFILNKIEWPAPLNCSSFPSPPQMCVLPALTSLSPSRTTSASLTSKNGISSLSYLSSQSSSPLASSSISPPPSDKSTTSKLSAPLPSHKLLIIVLSVAFGGLVVVLICI